jgi:TonB-dependent starch-binding outer membrane protein SusC
MNTNFYSPMKSMLLLCVFMLSTLLTFAQDRRVTGNVNASDGGSIPGASIKIKGTNTGTTTTGTGDFAINVKSGNDVLVVSSVGYKTLEVTVGTRTVINIAMQSDVAALDEVIVTGYQTLRKRDITGAVTVIETEGLKSVKGSSFTQNLAGRAPGVTISTSGSPGDATNVRIRGISSFTSNDPLYVIDGVPVKDQYQNLINPDDIESIQVLKDASTASIYGSRASNGVIVITTKQGKSGKTKVTYNGSFGLATSVKGYSDVLNQSTGDYAAAMRLKFPGEKTAWFSNAGSYPQYIHKPYDKDDPSTFDPTKYDIYSSRFSEPNKVGTDWWKLMTRTAQIHDHNISLSGGNDVASFSLTGSYLTQEGILNYTDFNRATIRANSNYKVTKSFRIGENLTYAANWGIGLPGGGNNEQGVIGNLLKATPVVPSLDINGNSSMHRGGLTGNFTNPDNVLFLNKDNGNKYNRLLGNIYAEVDLIKGLTLRTSFGVDYGNGFSKGFSSTANPSSTESVPTSTSYAFNENWNQAFTYTWTNTANYSQDFGKHRVGVLVGQEAIASTYRNIGGNLSNYFTTDINAWYLSTAFGDPTSRQVYSGGGESKLASYFGKVDYSFDDKYLISATVRRDGSSKFLSDVRYGIFPAVSLGWRVSQEGFMKELPFISDLKLRASYGEVGNQDIRSYNFSNLYGGSVGSTFYDINSSGSPATGYALTARGNASTIWESAKTSNFGIDAAFLNNSLTVVLDIYKRNTDNLLYNPQLPGTAGSSSPPFVNIGAMENTGFDLALNYRKSVSKDLSFNVGLNLSRYKNNIVKVENNSDFFLPNDGLDGRLNTQGFINKVGNPISSFRGFVVESLITTEAERANQYTGSVIGGLKFKDINGDGKITDDDRTIIGSPHPSLTAGLNLGANYRGFDLTAFMFGSFGNDIFNYTKMFSYFMNFNSNIGKDVLAIQGTGLNPKINGSDVASREASTFFIENGSYVRLANLQLGYRLPKDLAKKIGVGGARVYVQGQNLLTFTGYSGVDPAVSSAKIGGDGNTGDVSKSGFDGGHYPANKITTIGLSLEF